jgi:hypothetical protein
MEYFHRLGSLYHLDIRSYGISAEKEFVPKKKPRWWVI